MNYSSNHQSSSTILIVDDQPNNLQLLLQFLKSADYKILIAENGQKAIETASVYRPNLILLDVMMAGCDGFATCSHLKNQASTKDIPIIFMTALAETENKVRGFELGAVDYITKPINQDELLARLKTHLSLQSLNQNLAQEAGRQKLLSEVSDRIRQCLDLDSILQTAAQEIRTFLNCDAAWLAHVYNQEISIEAYASATDINLDQPVSWNDFCDHKEEYLAYQAGNVRVVNPIKHDQGNKELSSPNQPIRIIVPILINSTQPTGIPTENQTLWGWLVIDYSEASKWQAEENKLLSVLTTQLAIGIKQALLYEQLTQQVSIDYLTQVYNRRHFNQQLSVEWRRLKRTSSCVSLLMCDVDYFKLYNDTYGHQQGDECLQQVAQAISSAIKRPADVLARYGGEEFAIILPQTPQSGAIKVAEAMRAAVKKLKIPHLNSTADSVVTISIGVAHTIPNSEDSPQLLIEASDLALYKAKECGRNCIAVYPSPISHSRNQQDSENSWVKRIRQALKDNLFSLYAQSITPLDTSDQTRYFEILLRLTDESEQVITPNFFLNIAERHFMMPAIDTWVINTLLKQLASCDPSSWQNHRFAINLSGASLNSETFLEFLSQKLIEYQLPSNIFCFEITETVAVSDLDRVSNFIKTLRNLGCSFALDDFGKGMSSLTYLNKLSVDYLKIDGSFISDLNNNQAAKVMVEAISHIASGIGLKTVAEFVENQDILDIITDLKVDYAQGFHLGRPGVLMNVIS